MDAGLDRADRDIERLGDLGMAHPEVVVQDEDRSLFRRQAPEGPFQLIAVVDGQERIGWIR